MRKINMRKFRDRDFLKTKEDFFFCIVGPYHPPDRVISYLKYVPAQLGSWGKGKWRFKRALKSYTIPSLLETFQILERDYPHYIFDSTVYNIQMTAVPLQYIKKHYKPEEKLTQLMNAERLDQLQKKMKKLVIFLSEKSDVPLDMFGVTGSILLNIHRLNFSDIDLTIYGFKNSLAVKNALLNAYSLQSSLFKRFEDSALTSWCENQTRFHPLTMEEAIQIYKRQWNLGLFEETRFSVHPVKLEQEVTEEYGDKIYEPNGQVVIRAVVHENMNSMFLPATYKIKETTIINGPQVEDIENVVSYEGLYGDLAEVGETILVKGKLERVHDKKTKSGYHRILVGSPEGKGEEYLKIM
jgi:predicted nucleotidyltransferase